MHLFIMIMGALLLMLQTALAEDETIDGHYLCQSGVTTALKPLIAPGHLFLHNPWNLIYISQMMGKKAVIEKLDYDCDLMFLKFYPAVQAFIIFQ